MQNHKIRDDRSAARESHVVPGARQEENPTTCRVAHVSSHTLRGLSTSRRSASDVQAVFAAILITHASSVAPLPNRSPMNV